MKNYQSAKIAITQALKNNNTRWQFWDILLRISANLNDVKYTCNCIQTLINLGMVPLYSVNYHQTPKDKIEVWMVKYLVDSSGDELNSSVIEETLRLIVSNITESAGVWSEYSRYLSRKKDYVGALESKFKQYRKVEQNIQINLNNTNDQSNGSHEKFNPLELELVEVLRSMVELVNKVDDDGYKERVLDSLNGIKLRILKRAPEDNQLHVNQINDLINLLKH